METIQIKIAGKKYNVLAARTEEEREQGLQNIEELEKDEGCLFFQPEVEHVDYWMVDTDIPLDIIFIDENKEVISVKEGVPNSEDYVSEDGVKYVLELNKDSGVEYGDVLEIDSEDDFSDEPDLNLEPNKMYIIGSNGQPQAELQGEERIFSRKSTRVILRKAKKAYESKSDSDYRSLGRYVFNEMSAQSSRKPEYVDGKE